MEGSEECEIHTTTRDGVSVVTVVGDIDMTEGPALAAALEDAQGPLVADLRECTFMGSEGLRTLLEARRWSMQRHRRFVLLVRTPGPVARLLELTSARTIFNVCDDDLDAAVAMAATHDRRQGPDRRRGEAPE